MCKICQSKSTTNEKTTRRLALPPVELNRSPNSAELILDEESCYDEDCQTCDEPLSDPERISCEACNLSFHLGCV